MNELISIISAEIQKTRFGSIHFELTMHDGQIRCVNVTTSTRHNITAGKKKITNSNTSNLTESRNLGGISNDAKTF